MTESQAYVAFSLTDQVGSVKVAELVTRFGSVVAAWEAYPKKISRLGGAVDWKAEFKRAKEMGVEILTPDLPAYPRQLRVESSHPLALYVRGNVAALATSSLALVGTRRASPYGLEQASLLARDLAARGWTIVTGLALGIDAASHQGALAAGGTTIGVIGSGLDRFYPEENLALAQEIVEKGGAVVSEFSFGRPPDTQTFPQRNHTVAALARGVIAVEAPLKSGTLITTDCAVEMGRTVMAIPGRVDSARSAGCLNLIRAGARLVRNAADVESEMSELLPVTTIPRKVARRAAAPSAPMKPVRAAPPCACSVEEALIVRELTTEGVPLDLLVRRTGLPAAKVNALCMKLRVSGRIRFLPGNRAALPREG